MIKSTFQLTFSSELMYAKGVVRQIMFFLNNHFPDMDSDDLFDLKLIMSELLYNAVIHGNKSDNSKKVCVEIRLCEDNVCAKISDEGNGFNHSTDLDDECIGYSENGRGIRLVEALADNMRFTDRGNVVEIYKKVKLNE